MAEHNLATMYFLGQGVDRDPQKAIEWLRKSADHGLAISAFQLGMCYQQGFGVKREEKKSIEWLRKAADLGEDRASTELGWAYANGVGVTRDYAEAVKWYRPGAERGDPAAAYGLGVRYMLGQGVGKDYTESAKWLKIAADKGHGDAQFNLAMLEAQALSNPPQALKYATMAAEQDTQDAAILVAQLYANGALGPRNLGLAYQWALIAQEQGDPRAIGALSQLRPQLREGEQGRAEALAHSWLTEHPLQSRQKQNTSNPLLPDSLSH
jgi:hypothetical protein